MSHELTLKEIKKEWHGTLKAYVIGFIASIALTVASFSLVLTKTLSGQELIFAILGLAFVQAIVQVLFFLHVGQEAKPRWETLIFIFMVIMLAIIVIGTLWVMNDLNARVMLDMPTNMPMEMTHD